MQPRPSVRPAPTSTPWPAGLRLRPRGLWPGMSSAPGATSGKPTYGPVSGDPCGLASTPLRSSDGGFKARRAYLGPSSQKTRPCRPSYGPPPRCRRQSLMPSLGSDAPNRAKSDPETSRSRIPSQAIHSLTPMPTTHQATTNRRPAPPARRCNNHRMPHQDLMGLIVADLTVAAAG